MSWHKPVVACLFCLLLRLNVVLSQSPENETALNNVTLLNPTTAASIKEIAEDPSITTTIVPSDEIVSTTLACDYDDNDFKINEDDGETSVVGNKRRTPWWKRRPYPIRQRAPPCSCGGYKCGCCAGIELQRLNISQHGCLNFLYDPDEFSFGMEVLMNEHEVLSRSVSGRNPPPLCLPFPSPVSIIPRVEFCIRFFNVFTPGRNFHVCIEWITKINQSPVLELQFDCLRIGVNGIALVKPDAGGGLIPEITGGGIDYGGGGGGISGTDEDYDPLDPEDPTHSKKPNKQTKPNSNNTNQTSAIKNDVNFSLLQSDINSSSPMSPITSVMLK